jgi:hypothetical protein
MLMVVVCAPYLPPWVLTGAIVISRSCGERSSISAREVSPKSQKDYCLTFARMLGEPVKSRSVRRRLVR